MLLEIPLRFKYFDIFNLITYLNTLNEQGAPVVNVETD